MEDVPWERIEPAKQAPASSGRETDVAELRTDRLLEGMIDMIETSEQEFPYTSIMVGQGYRGLVVRPTPCCNGIAPPKCINYES